MPLETASYLSQLVPTNPTATDPVGQGDDHLRLLKAVLQAQFPNFTNVSLQSTQAQIDAAVSDTQTVGVAIFNDAGVFFKTNTTDGLKNPAAGEVDIVAAGVAAAKVKSDGSVTASGALSGASVSSTTAFSGGTGQLVPVGATLVWWDDTLPTEGGYVWANGAPVSRTTYPVLFARWGTRFGAGDGSTTFNVPDLREAVPVGKGTMGVTSEAGRITNFVTTTLGAIFGECLHLLGITELPETGYTSSVADAGHTHFVANTGTASANLTSTPTDTLATNADLGGSSPFDYNLWGNTGVANAGVTSLAITGVSVTTTVPSGGSSHNNVQPSTVCNWIIRAA